MTKTRKQFALTIIDVTDLHPKKNEYVFNEQDLDLVFKKSKRLLVSENRTFRMFCKGTEERHTLRRGEDGRILRNEATNERLYDTKEVASAREFTVVNMADSKDHEHAIRKILEKGYMYYTEGGEVIRHRRVLRSPSQVRMNKAFFTSLDVDTVRKAVSYNADFGSHVVIAQMEARYGLALSSSLEIVDFEGNGINFTFEIMPDFSIERKHDIRIWDENLYGKGKGGLATINGDVREYEPLDGQGTILPSAAVRKAHSLQIISNKERDFLLTWLDVYNEDIRIPVAKGKEAFLKIWRKVPSAFQLRFGLSKGLLVVHPHNLETTDCNGSTYREDTSKCMTFYAGKGDLVTELNEDGEEVHRRYYDFNRDIMFTDSMWKENFDPAYLLDADSDVPMEQRAKFEVVLWQKNRSNDEIFMGYQYWQALPGIDIKPYAARKIKEIKDTIFSDWKEALLFLGQYDSGKDADAYEEKAEAATGKIQKVILALNENPEVIHERWIQEVIRETRRQYIERMKQGRIAVTGHNPYVISPVECQFGRKSELKTGEYYYNGKKNQYALFRSPLIHKSEVVVANTVDVENYHGFYQDILVINPFDDTLPRMGGADTDGDKVAMVQDKNIIAHVQTGLPMLFDEGRKAGKSPNTKEDICLYDGTTIFAEIQTIGELTNIATTWKDIADDEKMLSRMNLTLEQIDEIVCILRFSQGTSIDYAKTGYFLAPPSYAQTLKSPKWKAWSRRMAELNMQGAEVYDSNSQMSRLYRSVEKYLVTKFLDEIKAETRDFTFEFTENVDYEEMLHIKPLIAEIENNYRNELRAMHDMKLDEDQTKDYITAIMDKYQSAVLSIDADIRTIAAAAYIHTYYQSSSKSSKISFPWITCFDGLMLNLSETTGKAQKLRRVEFEGHIDNVPDEIKIYRNEAKGDGYKVSVKARNGKYETFRKHGQVYIVMTAKSLAKSFAKKSKKPLEKTILFQINSLSHNNCTSTEFVELLKENGGVVRIQKTKDVDHTVNQIHAGVWIGKRRVGNVSRYQKHTMIPYLQDGAVEFKVIDLDAVQPTYISNNKKNQGEVCETKFFNLQFSLVRTIETEKDTVVTQGDTSQEYDDESGIPVYADEDIPSNDDYAMIETEIDFDGEEEEQEQSVFDFDSSILKKMNSKADYWKYEIQPHEIHIVGGSVERLGAIKIGQPCIQVQLLAENNGKSATLNAIVVPQKGYFEIQSTDRKVGEKVSNLILQLAHYEIYKEMVINKRKNA